MAAYTFEQAQDRALKAIAEPLLPRFDNLVRNFVLLNTALFAAMAIEIVLLLLFFTFLAKSALLAFGLALFFLTVFAYFILHLYYQTAKPEQLQEIVNQFVANYKSVYGHREANTQASLSLSNACTRLSDQLSGKEAHYYQPPDILVWTTSYLEKFSTWWHWQDVHKMRELLLQSSIDQHLQIVRSEPTNWEVHAALGKAYLHLAELYSSASRSDLFSSLDSYTQELPKKFLAASERAIEEFKILKEYAPKDPWPHLQLACTYHDLNRPLEEIAEYEALSLLNPEDQEVLYKLGCLYFAQGMNGKGLRIYNELRQNHFDKADSLIQNYGC